MSKVRIPRNADRVDRESDRARLLDRLALRLGQEGHGIRVSHFQKRTRNFRIVIGGIRVARLLPSNTRVFPAATFLEEKLKIIRLIRREIDNRVSAGIRRGPAISHGPDQVGQRRIQELIRAILKRPHPFEIVRRQHGRSRIKTPSEDDGIGPGSRRRVPRANPSSRVLPTLIRSDELEVGRIRIRAEIQRAGIIRRHKKYVLRGLRRGEETTDTRAVVIGSRSSRIVQTINEGDGVRLVVGVFRSGRQVRDVATVDPVKVFLFGVAWEVGGRCCCAE